MVKRSDFLVFMVLKSPEVCLRHLSGNHDTRSLHKVSNSRPFVALEKSLAEKLHYISTSYQPIQPVSSI